MLSIRRSFAGLFLGAAIGAGSVPALAQDQTPPQTPERSAATDPKIRYATGVYLAYVRHSTAARNTAIEAGLLNLALEAGRRTTIDAAGVAGVNLERDDLSFFPMLYWQIDAGTAPLSQKAQENLQKFVKSGRLLVIDMQPVQTAPGQPTFLRRILGNVQLLSQNKPLRVVEGGHGLTHSFYILDGLPGTHSQSYTLSNGTAREAATVVIGQNRNWAQAWAGISLQPDPDNDDQSTVPHERAMRAGINMVVSALNGTMKDDALHQETIKMKRDFAKKKPAPKP